MTVIREALRLMKASRANLNVHIPLKSDLVSVLPLSLTDSDSVGIISQFLWSSLTNIK